MITIPSRRDFLRGLMTAGGIGAVNGRIALAEGKMTYTDFVTRDGTGLTVGGEPFYFSGANNFWLVDPYSPAETVDELFSLAARSGINTVRTWASSEGQDGRCFQPAPGEYGEEAFERLDYVVAKAAEHGIRLVLTLVDNWSYYGGMDQYVDWSSTASDHDDFYTDDATRRLYKEYVEHVLTRTNTYTGVAYRDDPTILLWELANEPRVRSDPSGDILAGWIDEMAGFVKDVDPNHLVSTGMEGFYSGESGWMYDGSQGTDYVRHHQSSAVDVCSFHLYPDHWGVSESTALEWIETHVQDAHETIGKPAYLGEFGWKADRSDPARIRERNRVYEDWYERLDAVDADGALVWHLVTSNYENGGEFDIYQSDDGTTALLSDAANRDGAESGSGTDP